MSVTTQMLTVGEALTRLAVARGGLLDDVTSEVYLDRLARFDAALVARACEQWADVKRKDYETTLPAVGQLIETIEQIARADQAAEAAKKLLPMPKGQDDEPRFFCRECCDEPNGWRHFHCRGSGPQAVIDLATDLPVFPCARTFAHPPHPFVERCACLPYNPKIAEAKRNLTAYQARKKEARA